MSILIKGLKMPKSCCDCIFDVWGACLININTEPKNKLTHSCPLIELPDHGDLIDRDALRQEMRLSDSCKRCERDAYKCQYYDEMTVMDVCERIDDAPVVIPEERSEK